MPINLDFLSPELYFDITRVITRFIPSKDHLFSSSICTTFKEHLTEERIQSLEDLATHVKDKIVTMDVTWINSKKQGNENNPGEVVKRALDFILNQNILPNENECKQMVKLAVENGQLEILQALLESGKMSEDDCRGSALFFATEKGDLEIAQAMLKSGSIIPYYRNTTLPVAAENGHLEIVQALLESGTFDNGDMAYASGLAALQGQQEIEQLLASLSQMAEKHS
jgi:hypothetical protein